MVDSAVIQEHSANSYVLILPELLGSDQPQTHTDVR